MNFFKKKLILPVFTVLIIMFFISELLYTAGLYYEQKAPDKSLNYYSFSSEINRFHWKSFFRKGQLQYNEAIKTKDLSLLKSALNAFEKAAYLNLYYYKTDVMMLKINTILKKLDDISIVSELDKLCRKYPNNINLEMLLLEKSFKCWKGLTDHDREKYASHASRLLKQRLNKQDFHIILKTFVSNTEEFEIIKKIIPETLNSFEILLDFIKIEQINIKADFFWIRKQLDILKKSSNPSEYIKSQKDKDYMYSSVINGWKKTFGVPLNIATSEKFLYKDEKNIFLPCHSNLVSNSEIFTVLSLKDVKGSIIIRAKSNDICGIYAYMSVYLNKNLIGGSFINGENTGTYSFPYAADINGDCVISIIFENDYYRPEGKQDRNLYIESVEVSL